MIYLDTSVLGALFFREAGAAKLSEQLKKHRTAGMAFSAWTLTEMSSVAGIKQRTGVVSAEGRREAMSQFHRFASSQLQLIELESADFRSAALLIDTPLNLRAGDALHLAIARRVGAEVATLDASMEQACKTAGIGALLMH